MIQPILVRPLAGGGYEIIAGERRFRAAQMAGLSEVPVVIRDVPDDAALAMALIENIQREDLNPLEEAQGVQRLIAEFDFTHERAAQAIGRSRSATTNLLRLLQLAAPVQELLMAGSLDMGHARALLAVPPVDPDPPGTGNRRGPLLGAPGRAAGLPAPLPPQVPPRTPMSARPSRPRIATWPGWKSSCRTRWPPRWPYSPAAPDADR